MKQRRSECPISFALDLFGDRWTLLIVRDVALYGRQRFGEFLQADEGIASNILAARLEMLVDRGVLSKRADPEHGSRRLYSLTERGLDLLPVLVEMIVWSAHHDDHSPVTDAWLTRARGDRPGLLADLRSRAAVAD